MTWRWCGRPTCRGSAGTTTWTRTAGTRGNDPDFLVDPYWTFFGSEYTVDEIEVVKRLRLVDEDGNEVRVE
ncbi:hypothetical protein RMN56_13100 [Micromonospora halotolerans]|uniref:Uncharacterized protein n=1 Tax=Micromonospora halotolerans TaxID=709879 RepID=A0ABZ0A3Q9_9ACTN|nr:hypothetical protein [Micromonospora halotolerans]WNM42199.1 hypothetical protein RMN56_13100 [Micromonospora halotolerans]